MPNDQLLILRAMTDHQLCIYLDKYLTKLRIAIEFIEDTGIDTSQFDEIAADLIDDIEVLRGGR